MFKDKKDFQDFIDKWKYMNTLIYETKFEGSQRAHYLTFAINENDELIVYTDPGDNSYCTEVVNIRTDE